MNEAERFIKLLKKLGKQEQAGLLLMTEGLNMLFGKEKSGTRAANRSSEEFRSQTFQGNP